MNGLLAQGLAVAGLAASVGVGLIFLTAGVEKLRHRQILAGVIGNYRILPVWLLAPVALLLPWLEVAIGAALVVGLAPVPVLAAMALLLVFALAMAINVARGRAHIDCGCGGPALRQTLSWELVGRNLLLAGILAMRLLPADALTGLDRVTAVAAGLGGFLGLLLFQSAGALGALAAGSRR